MDLKNFKIDKNKIITIALILIFLGSIFVTGTSLFTKKSTITLEVDFGMPNMVYRENIKIYKDMDFISSLAGYISEISFEKDGSIKCINSYCKTERQEWKIYKGTGLSVEEIKDLRTYLPKEGDILTLRYTSIPKNSSTINSSEVISNLSI